MKLERDIILSGVHIGEHSFVPEEIKHEIYDRVIKPGYNFVTIRPKRNIELAPHYFVEWAEYLAKHEVYFVFLYTIQNAPAKKGTYLDKETVTEMKRVAGKYFIGDMIGETGSSVACKWPGYYDKSSVENWDSHIGTKKHPDMKAAHDAYVKEVSKLVELDHSLGIDDVVSVEATGLNKYNAEAGVTIPMLELMCGSPDRLVSSLRGMARAFDSKFLLTISLKHFLALSLPVKYSRAITELSLITTLLMKICIIPVPRALHVTRYTLRDM